jgi:4-hydroxy-tetrahydrodipicolinate synthase
VGSNLFVLGSSGEVVFHDDATRRAIDPATERTIANARAAQDAGADADAVVVTAPFYTRASQPEIVEHFRYVHDALDIPVVAYDILA